jgi:hypothetical protein
LDELKSIVEEGYGLLEELKWYRSYCTQNWSRKSLELFVSSILF